jgi:hypothetical protein
VCLGLPGRLEKGLGIGRWGGWMIAVGVFLFWGVGLLLFFAFGRGIFVQ